MNNKQENNSIAEKVLGKIKRRQIKMKPKIHFIFGTTLLVLGVLVLILFIPYLISLIVFSLRVSGVLFLPKFGLPGMSILLSSLPWLLILITTFLILLLEIFARKFTFVYRKPAIYSLIAIIVIIFTGIFIIEKTSLHSSLFWKAQDKSLPAIGMIYRDFGSRKIDNIYHGIIIEMIDSGFKIETLCGEVITIRINSETNFISGTEFQENDIVVALGEIKEDSVQALNVRKVEQDSNLFSPRQGRGYRLLRE